MAKTTHGMTKHPLYSVWYGMHTRAKGRRALDLSRHDVRYCGARGVAVCERWYEFENFYADMAPTWQKGLTLDRIDGAGDYEPANCRWATQKEQQRNRRSNLLLDTQWGRITLVEAAERTKIHRSIITRRLRLGWLIDDALAKKPRLRRRRDALGMLV